ncbi:RNA polymerase sigma-54 factor RpoN [Desulfosporosinus metallidurans]|uniref:RNA polymerase sigma-54 factor RpoN n=1 Tax=Desulfosporosinus metallidurans TaxID=1888891 RepID=A0A1Q8R2R1_9FIRM|nr:RNA polymerase sigma-54 factor RpoN [Desulfosporosinus metallidurans]
MRFSENPRNPYSDQKLADLLKAKDMEISRRTVAKYRDELGIAATTVRKRY